MNNRYKDEMDKIILSNELKEKIIKNASKYDRKKIYHRKSIYLYRTARIAACFFICVISFVTLQNYNYIPPIEPIREEQDKSIQPTDSIETTAVCEEQSIQDKEELTSPNSPSGTDNNTVNKKAGNDIPQKTVSKNNSIKNMDEITVNTAPDENILTDNEKQTSISDNQNVIDHDNISMQKKTITTEENPPSSAKKSVSDSQGVYENQAAPGNAPMQKKTTIEQISEKLGYAVRTPKYIPSGYELKNTELMDESIVEISYENEYDIIYYRTAKNNEDIVDDCNIYTDSEEINVNSSEVTIKGNDNLCHNATWKDDDESFAVFSSNGIQKDDMIDIIESVS